MSFLTPLYIAGILAVSLPIVFHLIRRTPSGHLPFSTVMFLEPSPPRISKRKRLDNWLLLLLRGLALILLAMAFARPFVRQVLDSSIESAQGKQIAILIDTSASMRRGNLFQDARENAADRLNAINDADEVALYTFDREMNAILTFDEWASVPVDARKKLANNRLKKIKPTWAATHLGTALTEVTEEFEIAHKEKSFSQQFQQKEIVLITDRQLGSRIDALQTFEWPNDVTLSIETVIPAETTNAGIQFLASTEEQSSPERAEQLRVRVTNAADSTREQFQLSWKSSASEEQTKNEPPVNLKQQNPIQKSKENDSSKVVNVYVPPGQSRVVRAPAIPVKTQNPQLVLSGDEHDFDNSTYLQRRSKNELTVLYFGSETATDTKQPRYYIDRAFPETSHRTVTVVSPEKNEPLLSPVLSEIQLIVVTESQSAERTDAIQRYAENGGTVVQLLRQSTDGKLLANLSGNVELTAYEAEVNNYAMLTDIDMTHPIFAPFADSRFSDFTKIHIWKHRTIDLESLPNNRVLAHFDNGDPAIVEVPIGRGELLVFATGWHPADSELALSTKFVPLFNGILELGSGKYDHASHYTVGDFVPLAKPISSQGHAVSVTLPDQTEIQLGKKATSFTRTTTPGVYTVSNAPMNRHFAVNLDGAESKTSLLAMEKLESLGIKMSQEEVKLTPEEMKRRQRQLHNIELESRQRIWRWLIAAALIILVLETWLAGRTAVKGIHARTSESTD